MASTAAILGMTSELGGVGNFGIEGVWRDGTARTRPLIGSAGSLARDVGTTNGVGGSGTFRSGVKNVWFTAPLPDSVPITGAVVEVHSRSDCLPIRYL